MAERKDPLPVFCFKVQLDSVAGVDAMFFKSVSGLRYETEVVPVREGGQNATTYQLWGATKWSNIVLKQGFTAAEPAPFAILKLREQWLGLGEPGEGGKRFPARITGTIIQLDTALNARASWKFYNAWPVKWELSEFDASKSELAIETLELAHEGIKFEVPDNSSPSGPKRS